MGVCNCSMFCCMLLYVHYSIAIILMGKREPVALLNLSSWCLVMVVWLFLAVPRGCLRFVIVVFSDHTHYLSKGTCPGAGDTRNIAGLKCRDVSPQCRGCAGVFISHLNRPLLKSVLLRIMPMYAKNF